MATAPKSSEVPQQVIRRLARLLPLSALVVGPAWGAQWHGTISLGVDQTYTDNVTLAPSGQEQSEWVTQLRPTISFNYNGPKVSFTAAYTAELLYFASSGDTALRHQFSAGSGGGARTNWELVDNFLYLDTNFNVTQRNTSLLGPQAQSNVNLTGNRATVVTGVASPYIRYEFGNEAIGTLRYTYSLALSDADNAGLSDSGSSRIDARLESGPSYRKTRWYVAYNKELIDYRDDVQENRFEQLSAGVQHLVTNNLAATATVGYDDNDYVTSTGEKTSGAFWTVGLNWTPTVRTNLSASYGKRYFGDTWGLSFAHRARLLVVNASYAEDVTTTRSLLTLPSSASTANILDTLFLAQIPDPVARQQAVTNFIATQNLPPNLIIPVDFFTNQVFLSKTWQVRLGLQGARHAVFGNFFRTVRDSEQLGTAVVGAGDFAASSTVKQTGVSGVWNWRLTPDDSTNFTLGYSRNEFPSIGREDDVVYFYWTYSHQFGRKLSGALNYRRLASDSNLGGTGTYTENAIVASLRMTF